MRRVFSFLLTASFVSVAFLPTCALAFAPSQQTRDLIRRQIETWRTPPPVSSPEVAETSSPESPAPEKAPVPGGAVIGDDPNAETPAEHAAQKSEQPVKAPPPPRQFVVGQDTLGTAAMLARFYEGREYRPAWSDDSGPRSRAATLLDTIQAEAEKEGLTTGDYRLQQLGKLTQQARRGPTDAQTLADLDFLLTDTFLRYSVHLSVGKTNFNALSAEWFTKQRKADPVSALHEAIETDRVEAALKSLAVQHPGYVQLRDALASYRAVAERGGWPRVPPGFDLHPGDHDRRVVHLRARLEATGELASALGAPRAHEHARGGGSQKRESDGDEHYDEMLVASVKKFQRRHGLTPDGVVGGGTLAALNVSVETRIRQILANMDRWRALPQDLGARYVAINVPNFTLDVMEQERSVLNMKVVVGKMVEKRSTPTFSASMTHLVLNPYWYVPKSIAEEELFPLSRKNPNYFAKNKFTVQKVAVGEKQVPDPNAADGSMTTTKIYQYRLRQEPGPKNALGRVKFIFPNAHGVYLHDTPSKALFERTVRTFSHGCIRVERPLDLAEYLLRDSGKWPRTAIQTTLDKLKEKTIRLAKPVPVYIQYWTAWVDTDGLIQFRNDIYGYDKVPGAKLPTSIAKKPRPVPTPREQPMPQTPQPALQEMLPSPATLQEAQPTLPAATPKTL